MRKIFFVMIVGILLSLFGSQQLYAGEIDVLVDKLVEKGFLTAAEAQAILEETKQEVAKEAAEKAKKGKLTAYWNEGLRFKTADEKFKLNVGGRIMVDAGWADLDSDIQSNAGEFNTDAEFRRARFYMSGSMYDNYIYKLQFDFAGGNAVLKDAYLGLKDIPYIGTIKAGHFKEPFGLEELTSSKYITFIERSLPGAFTPGRNVGIAINSTAYNERLTWAIGLFRDADSFGDVISSSKFDLTARLTWLSWYEDNGEKLLHAGLAYSLKNSDDTIQYRERPEVHLAPYFVDTGIFNPEVVNQLGYEAAVVYGPLSLQGEYMQGIVDHPNAYLHGLYAQASYFLSGEHRKYKNSLGTFSRVKPLKNFSIKGRTYGAWEIAIRYSYLDLNDDSIRGGIMSDATLGLNWYLNPNMRIMGNYVYSHLNNLGNANMFLTRFQVDF